MVGSAIAGATGARCRGRIPAKAFTRSPTERALDAFTSASRMVSEKRIGTSVSDSAPPAMTTSASPSAMCSAAEVIAWFAEAHARPTVKAGTEAGIPEPSCTSRAMLGS